MAQKHSNSKKSNVLASESENESLREELMTGSFWMLPDNERLTKDQIKAIML